MHSSMSFAILKAIKNWDDTRGNMPSKEFYEA